MKNLINTQNWTFSQYKSSKIRAFISLGGEVGPNEEFQELYLVTTTDEEFTKEFFQKPFRELEKAMEFINNRYGHWDFLNLEKAPKSSSDSGCSSCAAH
jgi:hypothetical protein